MKRWREEIKGFFVLGNHDYWSAGLKSYDEVIEMLKGIECGVKGTSCPDQVARALENYKKNNL